MRVIVDGHNALHRLGIRGGRHEDDRRELLLLVDGIDPRAEVYFDARHAPAGLPSRTREEGLTVFYCREQEADRAILDRIREAVRPREFLVVTDDREVAGGARQLGARSVSVREFFSPPSDDPDDEPPEGPPGFTPEDFGLPSHVNLKHPPRE